MSLFLYILQSFRRKGGRLAVSLGERQREKLSPDKKNGSLINNRLNRHWEKERETGVHCKTFLSVRLKPAGEAEDEESGSLYDSYVPFFLFPFVNDGRSSRKRALLQDDIDRYDFPEFHCDTSNNLSTRVRTTYRFITVPRQAFQPSGTRLLSNGIEAHILNFIYQILLAYNILRIE